jgi:hypothetical protein
MILNLPRYFVFRVFHVFLVVIKVCSAYSQNMKRFILHSQYMYNFHPLVGSLVATPDCKPAVPGSNLAISAAYIQIKSNHLLSLGTQI